MPSNPEPTQPLTDEGLEELREYATSDNLDLTPETQQRAWELLLVAYNEVDRLRTQSVRHVDCNAEAWAAAARVTRDLRAELDSMTQFAESLRAERDRSVRSCGELGVELDRLRAENTAQANRVDAFLAPHVLVHRNIAWYGEGGVLHVTEHSVCDYCVPQHASFNRREDIPEGPCEVRRALGVGDSGEPTDA